MELEIQTRTTRTVDVISLRVHAKPECWFTTLVNGVRDLEGDLIPCRIGEYWRPNINIETGIIENWNPGTTADIQYKVDNRCDYYLVDAEGNIVLEYSGYGKPFMCPGGRLYNYYIMISVGENGMIKDWDNSYFVNSMDDMYS